LRLHDDEPRFNPTLIEMLRQDFRLELPVAQGELPKDAHGLDVAGIWNVVSQTIKNIRGWEVVEDVVLSTFSFAKYLMWKDLIDRTDQLKQSPVVKHLIDTPLELYRSGGDFPDPQTLDQTYEPQDIFCPLSADSSQLSAVIAAANGKDFVLIGPPGTGKSQTIANLIAHCLAKQKTMLFVSQKMAALNVVYRRLCDIKLGDFCLELHSNKARKLDVIQQLGRAWDTKGSVVAEDWKKEAERLKALRDQLNEFVGHLHQKRRNGFTAYGAIGLIVAGRDVPKLGLSWSSPDIHSEDDLFSLQALAEKLDINARVVGGIAESPLELISNGEWSPTWQQSMVKAARDLVPDAKALETSAAAFLQATGLSDITLDKRRRDGLSMLSRVLPDAAGRDWRFALLPDVRTVSEELREGVRILEKHRETRNQLSTPWPADLINDIKHGIELIEHHREVTAKLSAPYSDRVSTLDVGQLETDWKKGEKSWWPLNRMRRRRVRSTLAGAVEGKHDLKLPDDIDALATLRGLESEIKNLAGLSQKTFNLWAGLETRVNDMLVGLKFESALSSVIVGQGWLDEGFETVAAGRCGSDMAADLERLRCLRSLEKKVGKLEHLHVKTNGLWTGLNTRIEDVENALIFQETLSSAIAKIATTADSLSNIKKPLERLLGDGNILLEPTGPVSGSGGTFREDLKRFESGFEKLSELAGTLPSDVKVKVGDTPGIIAKLCKGIVEWAPKLRSWCAWRKARGEAVTYGLSPLVVAVESGAIELGKARESFDTDYARWWLNAIVEGDDVLRNFVSVEHEKRIADFKELDNHFAELTRDYVRAVLCADLPDEDKSKKNPEWGILRHEMQKKKRHMPLRELMNRIPRTITKLTPCLLMSPLSIAQYLPTETAPFDVVVFDEASQIPVWDAIGSIARGKQVVMVGDPKQLPPTSFFDRAESNVDYEDVEGDLESILDECLGANLPTLNLSWHYRSRHESLITFSNNRYYGGGLVTFPSPSTEDKAVNLHIVKNGVYEKGGARINKPEAHAVVGHIVSRIADQEFRALGLTIGVVTFNVEQQRLIEDLLDSERRKNPSLEPFFAEDRI
jgi:hypothetical protein